MRMCSYFPFLYTAPPPTAIYTLSLHDALPISQPGRRRGRVAEGARGAAVSASHARLTRTTACDSMKTSIAAKLDRSEEHTSELQSHHDLVCRLLLEKKKQQQLHLVPTSYLDCT